MNDKLNEALKAFGANALEELGRALYAEALEVQRESMKRTPVDLGALRASHETTKPVENNGEVAVSILVGGPSAPYAWFVHERLDVDHPVGQAKFLQSAVLEAAGTLEERLVRRLKDRLK